MLARIDNWRPQLSICTLLGLYAVMVPVTAVILALLPSDKGAPELPVEGAIFFASIWPVTLFVLLVGYSVELVRWARSGGMKSPDDGKRRECPRCLALIPAKARWCPRCCLKLEGGL